MVDVLIFESFDDEQFFDNFIFWDVIDLFKGQKWFFEKGDVVLEVGFVNDGQSVENSFLEGGFVGYFGYGGFFKFWFDVFGSFEFGV